ncbi:hypothetical protein [Clostridium paraputrificum]|uniref:hypothetical protein n=1 Tax=Clostridium paraputrificum TaxID=29363 RepID=UPI0012B930AC|nr:hypothetical protein [Clostridium paraputrificum]
MKEKIEKVLKNIKEKIGLDSKKSNGGYQYKGRNYKSRKYNIALVVIVIGYLFFFSSNSLFNSEGDVMSTPFNKEIALPNYKMIMKNATYSNENGILEVNFSIEKTSVTFSGELLLEAKERNNPTKKLDVNMINLNGKDYTIIVKLPKEWTTILLLFTEDNESKTSAKFYVDRRESVEDKSLKEKSKKDYLLQTVDEEIKDVNKQIEEKNKEIDQLKNEINRLEIDKKYLTESELIDMNTKIDSLYSQKLDTEKSIQELNKSNEELKAKIEKLNLKKEDYKKILD